MGLTDVGVTLGDPGSTVGCAVVGDPGGRGALVTDAGTANSSSKSVGLTLGDPGSTVGIWVVGAVGGCTITADGDSKRSGMSVGLRVVGLALGFPGSTVGFPVVGIGVVGINEVGLALGTPGSTLGGVTTCGARVTIPGTANSASSVGRGLGAPGGVVGIGMVVLLMCVSVSKVPFDTVGRAVDGIRDGACSGGPTGRRVATPLVALLLGVCVGPRSMDAGTAKSSSFAVGAV